MKAGARRLFAPSRGRGLKLFRRQDGIRQSEFAPSRGRGLKRRRNRQDVIYHKVRPLTGARIETKVHPLAPTALFAPSRGRGLKHQRRPSRKTAVMFAPHQHILP